MYKYCLEKEYIRNDNCILCADGFVMEKEFVSPTVLDELQTIIEEKLGFELILTIKEMNKDYLAILDQNLNLDYFSEIQEKADKINEKENAKKAREANRADEKQRKDELKANEKQRVEEERENDKIKRDEKIASEKIIRDEKNSVEQKQQLDKIAIEKKQKEEEKSIERKQKEEEKSIERKEKEEEKSIDKKQKEEERATEKKHKEEEKAVEKQNINELKAYEKKRKEEEIALQKKKKKEKIAKDKLNIIGIEDGDDVEASRVILENYPHFKYCHQEMFLITQPVCGAQIGQFQIKQLVILLKN